jgi:hypothetical protein
MMDKDQIGRRRRRRVTIKLDGFEVLTAVPMKISIFWDIML